MAEQPEDKEARITLPISASSALLAMGFGLWWAWTDSFYLASPGASPSATSMIPSERCFISLGCGLALIALLLKQRRQKERAPRGIVWASALCMSVLPFIARVIPLYTCLLYTSSDFVGYELYTVPTATPHAAATARMLSAPSPFVVAISYAASRICSLLITGRLPIAHLLPLKMNPVHYARYS